MTPTELIDRILKLSRADDCMVIVEESSNVNVRWANNTVTTNGQATSRGLVIIAVRGRRAGVVERSYIDEYELEALVREAEHACEFQPEAEDYAELVAGEGEPAGWSEPTAATEVAVFDGLSRALAAAFQEAEAAGRCHFGYAEHSRTTTWLANSRGVRRRHVQTKGQVELTLKTRNFSASAWTGQATKAFADIDVPALVTRLNQQLDWSKTKIELPAGTYETLLTPSAVADLLIYSYWSSAVRDAVEGRTVFSKAGGKTKIGDRLASGSVTIYSDPHERGLEVSDFMVTAGSSSYASIFDNGAPLARTNWIENGVLQHLITPRYYAKKQKLEPTLYVDNLVVEAGGKGSLEDLIKGVKRGLLVTCLWYIREVDPQRLLLTGLTRDGVYLIEDGEVKGVVNNFRFNMSPVELLTRIEAAGATTPTLAREWGDYFTFAKMPPLVIRDFNMSSVSQAT